MGKLLLKFRYINWEGDEHEYIVDPQEILSAGQQFVIHATCLYRDGQKRDGELHRTFYLLGMKNLEEVWEHDL